jgi:tRNA splicing endonuclease
MQEAKKDEIIEEDDEAPKKVYSVDEILKMKKLEKFMESLSFSKYLNEKHNLIMKSVDLR